MKVVWNLTLDFINVIFKTRTLDNGKKVLAVEEQQSDFVIAAIKTFKQTGKSTDFPFKNTWYELTIKRLIRYAADNGFDAISIPKGELAANRYGQKIASTPSNCTLQWEMDRKWLIAMESE